MESMFLSSCITSDLSKYHHTVSALDINTMVEVEDILCNPPEERKYVQLKTEIIKWFSESADKQLHKAFSEV